MFVGKNCLDQFSEKIKFTSSLKYNINMFKFMFENYKFFLNSNLKFFYNKIFQKSKINFFPFSPITANLILYFYIQNH